MWYCWNITNVTSFCYICYISEHHYRYIAMFTGGGHSLSVRIFMKKSSTSQVGRHSSTTQRYGTRKKNPIEYKCKTNSVPIRLLAKDIRQRRVRRCLFFSSLRQFWWYVCYSSNDWPKDLRKRNKFCHRMRLWRWTILFCVQNQPRICKCSWYFGLLRVRKRKHFWATRRFHVSISMKFETRWETLPWPSTRKRTNDYKWSLRERIRNARQSLWDKAHCLGVKYVPGWVLCQRTRNFPQDYRAWCDGCCYVTNYDRKASVCRLYRIVPSTWYSVKW